MYERSPAYFKQFQKNFRFYISEEKPCTQFFKNFALCMHQDSVFCRVLPSNHYHVLFDVCDVSTEFLKRTKFYSVPCLYTTFSCLFSNCSVLQTTGEVFEKFKLAVEYNGSNTQTKGETNTIQKRLPNFSH